MPEMTGVEFLMHAQKILPESIRVILTGYSDINVIIEAVNDCNIFRYLTKPWKEKEMNAAIATALETYRLREDNENLYMQLKSINESLEQTVKERTQHLVDLNEEKNRLINVVSHDLRSPLNNILGLTNLLNLKEYALNSGAQEIVSKVTESASRLSNMIKRILDVGAIESKKNNIKIENVNLTEVLKKVSEDFQLASKEKRIKIVHEFSIDPVYARVDKNYLMEVLENLVSNALKFSEFDKRIMLRLHKIDHTALASVKDEGPGISEEDQAKLFQNFQTLSARPTAGEISTGLGLAICKKYVEAMNGKIYCQSELGGGTEFIVELPLS
jgi:signal transduction histidine kinase